MLNKDNIRELAYLVTIDAVTPIEGYDRVELAHVGGWTMVVGKQQFYPGEIAVYFEIDSKLPEVKPFTNNDFLAKKRYKVKTQKMCKSVSQGLLMSPAEFGWTVRDNEVLDDCSCVIGRVDDETRFLTQRLGITYAVAEDNSRKAKTNPDAKYQSMMLRHPKFAKTKFARWCMKRTWAKKILYIFLGSDKKDIAKQWPVGKFPGVSKTDQERVENMTWILEDKTPFIVTQKCDGSSGTYILEKKKGKFNKTEYEFFVCSRNIRMKDKDQECFYGAHNYYWEVANKYNIQEKMKTWLDKNPDATFVCWQGEICAPAIQGNPHGLTETHFYCFHWTDSINGRMDIRKAKEIWNSFNMEVVPIVNENYIIPDDFEEFKLSADGMYNSEVCEGKNDCPREGFVYYKTTNPTFSFKNVSREYLLNH